MRYSEQAYEQRIQQLFERHQSVQSVGFTTQAYKPGLDGMRALDQALGCPSGKFRSIHVAGTNGKGTVCCMLAAQLAAKGLRVGLYTSPHLLDFRERIKIIDDTCQLIPRESVWEFLELAAIYEEGRSFFEITTAMAFWWFAEQEVDVAVIETGLGGRLDSTNILTPELAVITSIGLDHCAILGDTRSRIAAEKAGIFKPGVPAVIGECDPETAPVFEQTAADVHCPIFFVQADDSDATVAAPDATGWAAANDATVRLAMELLGEDIDEDALADYASITGLRGRWDVVRHAGKTLIFDIGHNPPALERNFARLGAMVAAPSDIAIVYGVMADKDLDSISHLLPSAPQYILVAPATSRSLPAPALKERLAQLRPELGTAVAASVGAGLELALSGPAAVVYVGGSTFVVAEALACLQQDAGK